MKSKLAIFDYDGVIADSMPHNLAVVKKASEQLGFSVFPDADYCKTAECISFETWAKKIQMSDEQLTSFVELVHHELTGTAHGISYFPNIPEMFTRLALTCDLALITGNVLSAAKRFLDEHNLSRHFSVMYGAETKGTKSEKIKELAASTGHSLDTVYYIGDAGTDIIQGRLAGVKTIAVTWGFQGRERLLRENPDIIVDSPLELAAALAI